MVIRSILVTALLAVVAAGESLATSPVDVVVSIPPQQWLVEQIGGELVRVSVLVTPGESPATYMPSDAQVTHLMRSQIYFRIGVPFERGLWFDAVSKMGRFEMVDQRGDLEAQDDPHIWLSPRLLSMQAGVVTDALSQTDPNNQSQYRANLQRLRIRLGILDEEIRRLLAPFAGRRFFVFHPSWGHFADEYDLQQVAIEIDGREPSDQEMTRLQAEAKEARVHTVFVQPQIHGRAAQAFAEALGAQVEILDPMVADVAANLAETTGKLVEALSPVEK